MAKRLRERGALPPPRYGWADRSSVVPRAVLRILYARGEPPGWEDPCAASDTKGCVSSWPSPQYFVEFPLTGALGPCMLGATGM